VRSSIGVESCRAHGPVARAPAFGIDAIKDGLKLLERFSFTCRKAGQSPFLRELVIPFGHTGYVALFEIVDNKTVAIGAIRHQREDDYH
jgi:ParE toxin of type II toxin-antitoxin system, parDE